MVKIGRPEKLPIYILPFNIEVIGEYYRARYCYCYIRRHPFFSGTLVARGRLIMASVVGRELHYNEHVHHKDGDFYNDMPTNLEILSAAEHNRLHKLGFKHTEETKQRISESLKDCYARGLREAYVNPFRCPETGRFL